MTENAPRSTDRWLPILGAALVVETLIAVSPSISKYGVTEVTAPGIPAMVLFYLCHVMLPGALGALALVAWRGQSLRVSLARIAFITLFACEASTYAGFFLGFGPGNGLFLFQPISALLLTLGAAALWGTALARCDDPGSLQLQKYGRIAAGLVQLGFVFQFAVRLQSWNRNLMNFGEGSAAGALYSVWTLGDIAENLLLLWASVEAVRTNPDEAAVARRARKIHRLMTWWIILVPITSLLYTGVSFLQTRETRSLQHQVWQLALYGTLLLTAAFALARRYRTSKDSYNSESLDHA